MPISFLGVAGSLAATLTLIGTRSRDVRHLRHRQLRRAVQGVLPGDRAGDPAPVAPVLPGGPVLPGRVLLPAPVLVPGHADHAVLARPAHAVHLPRAGLRAGVPDGRAAQARPPVERGRPEVLPDRRAVHGRDALRDEPDLRGRPGRSPWRASGRAWPRPRGTRPLALAAILFVVVGFAFKVCGGAVPVLGAGHLRGLPGPRRGVPVGRSKAAGFAGLAAADVRGLRRPRPSSGRRCSRCCPWRP